MTSHESRTQLRHPDPQKTAPRIDTGTYEAVRAALLQALAEDAEGVPFTGLTDRVAQLLPKSTLDTLGSVGWYTMAVKLDLEARGEIERVPGSGPQRLRKVT